MRPTSAHEWLVAMVFAGAGVGLASGLGAGTPLSVPFGVLLGVMHGFFMAPIAWRTIRAKPVIPSVIIITLPTMAAGMLTAMLLSPALAWGASLSLAIIMLLIVATSLPDAPGPTLIPCAACGYDVQDVTLRECPQCGASLLPEYRPDPNTPDD